MTSANISNGVPRRPASALTCQRVGGCPARVTVTALVVVALLVGAGLFCVWSRTEVVRQGYELSKLSADLKELCSEHEMLRVEAARLKSPERIERIAGSKLDMQMPEPGQVVNIGADPVKTRKNAVEVALGP